MRERAALQRRVRHLLRRGMGRPRGVWALAGPVLFQEVALVATGAVVVALASHLGPSSVAAIGLVDALGNLLNAVFGALAVGATVTAAHCLGARRHADLRAVAVTGLALGAAAGTAVAVLLWLTQPVWLALFMPGAEPAVLAQAGAYFRWLIVADLPTAVVLVGCGLLRGMRRTGAATRVQVVMNLLQVTLAATLMHGLNWGVAGAGGAMLVARSAGLVLALTALRPTLQRSDPSETALPVRRSFVNAIVKVGWPAALESSFFHIGKLITQAMVIGLGTTAAAANFVAFSVTALMNVPGTALGAAATTLVGMRLGAGDARGARRSLQVLVRSAAVALSLLALVVLPLSGPLAGLFGSDPAVTQSAARLIALNCLFMPFWSASFMLPAGLRGAGDTRYALVVASASMWLCRIATGYLLGIVLGLGVVGVWLGMFADWLVRGLLFRRRVRGLGWTRHHLLG